MLDLHRKNRSPIGVVGLSAVQVDPEKIWEHVMQKACLVTRNC